MKLRLSFFVTLFLCFFAISCGVQKTVPSTPTINKIQERGILLVGTTGDYRPLSYKEPETGEYWGFGIDVAGEMPSSAAWSVTTLSSTWKRRPSNRLRFNKQSCCVTSLK